MQIEEKEARILIRLTFYTKDKIILFICSRKSNVDFWNIFCIIHKWLRWSRGSVLAFRTQVRWFKPGRSRRIFRAKKSSARLPSEGK